MKNISRLTAATVLVALLAVVATGVWAAPKFQGTVPPPPDSGESTPGSSQPIEMGTAVFTPDCATCTVVVHRIDEPEALGAVPDGKQFIGDAFEVKINGTGSVKVSFALPPEFESKHAKIFKLDISVSPAVWVEATDAVVNADGTISVDITEGGTFSLIGDL